MQYSYYEPADVSSKHHCAQVWPYRAAGMDMDILLGTKTCTQFKTNETGLKVLICDSTALSECWWYSNQQHTLTLVCHDSYTIRIIFNFTSG